MKELNINKMNPTKSIKSRYKLYVNPQIPTDTSVIVGHKGKDTGYIFAPYIMADHVELDNESYLTLKRVRREEILKDLLS